MWRFPLKGWNGAIPIEGDNAHSEQSPGVCFRLRAPITVVAVEEGEIISVNPPVVLGDSGVITYGGTSPNKELKKGDRVNRGQAIGQAPDFVLIEQRTVGTPGMLLNPTSGLVQAYTKSLIW